MATVDGRNPNHQLMVNIPCFFLAFNHPKSWWYRISSPSTVGELTRMSIFPPPSASKPDIHGRHGPGLTRKLEIKVLGDDVTDIQPLCDAGCRWMSLNEGLDLQHIDIDANALSICLSIYLSFYLSTYLSISWSYIIIIYHYHISLSYIIIIYHYHISFILHHKSYVTYFFRSLPSIP